MIAVQTIAAQVERRQRGMVITLCFVYGPSNPNERPTGHVCCVVSRSGQDGLERDRRYWDAGWAWMLAQRR